ncbi:hypothetical protein MMC24_002461 [Lignoscripta atroalba]|nr:hypothetical protein [Lignoscripta atroalba]
MSNTIVAVVTGANRGIGEAICQVLANTAQEPLVLYATSRKGVNLGIKTSSNETQVIYPSLDINDRESIQALANSVKKDHGGCHVLINNAGINLEDQYSPDNVKKTLDTNYRGTLHMCQAFIPLLKKGGRIVNVSSVGSSLNQYSDEIKQRFRDPKMTLEDLEGMMTEYQRSVDEGAETKHGWPRQAYSVSKACVNAITMVLARENPGLIINACCPGWVSTDMGRVIGSPPKRPVDGAKIPIRLGFKDINGVTGRYWGNPTVSDTEDGQIQSW